MKTRPVIGITGPDGGGGAAWRFTALAIHLAGGTPVRLTPGGAVGRPAIQGLILGGGGDVHPERYGEIRESLFPPHEVHDSWGRYLTSLVVDPFVWMARYTSAMMTGAQVDEARDEFEFKLFRRALAQGWPVLGVCRGAQLINVYFGGSLHQNLSGFYTEEPEIITVFPKKQVIIHPGTRLASVIGDGSKWVNSLHRQGVKNLGCGLRVAARDSNRIVQAIEHPDHPFVLGVQWHPEYMPQAPEQRALFRTLVERAHMVTTRNKEYEEFKVASAFFSPIALPWATAPSL
jgi:putative glutamine amidotransferase